MQCFEIQESFGLESLVQTVRTNPTVGPGQVLIKVGATSLNYRDLLMVLGMYNPKQALPLIPMSDGVGTISAVGEGVTRVKVGDRVAGIFSQRWLSGEPTRPKLRATLGGPLDGMLAEYVVLHEEGVTPVPSHLTDVEAATLPCAAVTAWNALVIQGRIKAGDTVLVQGTGGVSIFALQFAKMMGARIIVISSRDEKLARAQELGASDLINYNATPDWDKRARELTDGVGVDHIVEVGGADTFAKSLRAIRIGGQISVIGALSGASLETNLLPILMQAVRVQGVLVGSREVFEAMNKAIALHQMRPIVDSVFAFEDARHAFESMASGAHFGKICIQL